MVAIYLSLEGAAWVGRGAHLGDLLSGPPPVGSRYGDQIYARFKSFPRKFSSAGLAATSALAGFGRHTLGLRPSLARIQNSAFDLAFDNGSSKSNSLVVGCGRKRHASNKCYHASSNRRVGG